MKKIQARYPIKIGKVLIPKGEIGRVASLEEMQKIFPNIGYNPQSTFCGVVFRDLSPCLVTKDQLLFA